MILADEFRDGNVPAGSGNQRVVEQALAALPRGVDEIRLRADSALYEQPLLGWLEARGIGYAISADMGRELAAAIRALPERAWQPEREDTATVRHWAEVPYVPSDGVSAKGRSEPPRYLAIRIIRKQGELFADGSTVNTSPRSPTCPTRRTAAASICCAGTGARRAPSSTPTGC